MLLDSNIIIYSYQSEYPAIDHLIATKPIKLSEISYIETIGYQKITPLEEQYLKALFAATTVLPIDSTVIKQATSLRQQRKMSLVDALIAATALIYELTLITRNTADFKWILDIELINPIDDLNFDTSASKKACYPN
jgi:predicted nucleic acid-binding protein